MPSRVRALPRRCFPRHDQMRPALLHKNGRPQQRPAGNYEIKGPVRGRAGEPKSSRGGLRRRGCSKGMAGCLFVEGASNLGQQNARTRARGGGWPDGRGGGSVGGGGG
jgi:hypothetical protein